MNQTTTHDAGMQARAWPFVEARRVLERLQAQPHSDDPVLFETGYGPSGLPHIGTFGEVARTSMVRHAFRHLSDRPTRLVVFSDDLDGLRRVPDNLPGEPMLRAHLGRSLTDIPDPYGKFPSFGAHNNAMLQSFLDRFGFEYEFVSATECYQSGMFDPVLHRILVCYDEIMAIVLPELGPERRQSYSPFLPICPRTRQVRQEPILSRDVEAGTVTWRDPDTGEHVETSIYGGRCKLQWRVDWAMRWVALPVDYEMSGKDLIDSVRLSGRIARALGERPPLGLTYELFLDENGEKISKSRGNGLTIDEWLRYGAPESLQLFMYGKPKAAKRLHFDVIPRMVDEYLTHLTRYDKESCGQADISVQIENPVWHIHEDNPPPGPVMPNASGAGQLTFGLVMNLATACDARDAETLWGFIRRYQAGATPERYPILASLIEHALRYSHDFVLPNRHRRSPNSHEAGVLRELRDELCALPEPTAAETIQNLVYALGKQAGYTDLRAWFRVLYQILLGQDDGPRFGSFVELHGIHETVGLIDVALRGGEDC